MEIRNAKDNADHNKVLIAYSKALVKIAKDTKKKENKING